LARRTQRLDLIRAVPLGVLMPLESTLLIVIALTHFDAPNWIKGVIAAAGGLGLLASPLVTSLTRRSGLSAMRVGTAGSLVIAAGLAAGTIDVLWLFVVGAVLAVAAMNASVPLFTVMYERNYPPTEIGQRVGKAMMVKVVVSVGVGLGFGWLLKSGLQWWFVPALGAASALAMALVVVRIPSEPIDHVPGVRNTVWPHFHLLAEDRQLRTTLISWMFMGFGNLMLLPLRIEYLHDPRYGVSADTAKIATLTIVVPSIARVVAMPLFGKLFDGMSFFSARILVNVFFAAYIAAFFTGTSDVGLITGSVLLGVGAAGGDLMWSLWVTKFAPPGRTADYMGLHTFSTGVRALLAPLLGFLLIGRVSLFLLAMGSAAAIVVASLTLLPEMRAERGRRDASVLLS
jgi:hypothetical protein